MWPCAVHNVHCQDKMMPVFPPLIMQLNLYCSLYFMTLPNYQIGYLREFLED